MLHEHIVLSASICFRLKTSEIHCSEKEKVCNIYVHKVDLAIFEESWEIPLIFYHTFTSFLKIEPTLTSSFFFIFFSNYQALNQFAIQICKLIILLFIDALMYSCFELRGLQYIKIES